jgi:hypothetical protein
MGVLSLFMKGHSMTQNYKKHYSGIDDDLKEKGYVATELTNGGGTRDFVIELLQDGKSTCKYTIPVRIAEYLGYVDQGVTELSNGVLVSEYDDCVVGKSRAFIAFVDYFSISPEEQENVKRKISLLEDLLSAQERESFEFDKLTFKEAGEMLQALKDDTLSDYWKQILSDGGVSKNALGGYRLLDKKVEEDRAEWDKINNHFIKDGDYLKAKQKLGKLWLSPAYSDGIPDCRLYLHGTQYRAIDGIANNGFDLSFNSGGMFGRGVYFTDVMTPSKSLNYTYRGSNPNGKFMLICRINHKKEEDLVLDTGKSGYGYDGHDNFARFKRGGIVIANGVPRLMGGGKIQVNEYICAPEQTEIVGIAQVVYDNTDKN